MDRHEYACPKCDGIVKAPLSLAGEMCDCPLCGEEVERWPNPQPEQLAPDFVTTELPPADELEHGYLTPYRLRLGLYATTVLLIVVVIVVAVVLAVRFWQDVAIVSLVLVFIVLALKPTGRVCPRCKKRAGGHWDRQRVDGRVDRRHKRNAFRCANCHYILETYRR